VSTKPVMGTTATGRRHKRWPETLKREIVAASLAPGGVGLNRSPAIRREREPGLQLAKALSRRRLCAIELDSPSTGSGGDYSGADAVAAQPPVVTEKIEIDVSGKYRIRVACGFDCQALRRVLDVLERR
jgi:transposase